MTTEEKVKEIKQAFRQAMDGATAQSMRQKGLDYRLNWGVAIPQLRQMAEELTQEGTDLAALGARLWREDVRECKILATMLMPPGEMPPALADLWMEQTPTLEIAEQAVFNLYRHLPYAADKAFEWIASPSDMPQVCGYHVLSRLFMGGREINERAINEFLDQAVTALQSGSPALRKAAMQAMVHFADMSIMHQRLAKSATRRIGLTFL